MFRALLLLPLLAACDSGAATNTAAPAAAAPQEDYVARVRALPEGQRNGVLFRAIRDGGRECQGVTRSEAAAEAAWVATCDDGGQWVVALARDGTATVTNAREMAGRGR